MSNRRQGRPRSPKVAQGRPGDVGNLAREATSPRRGELLRGDLARLGRRRKTSPKRAGEQPCGPSPRYRWQTIEEISWAHPGLTLDPPEGYRLHSWHPWGTRTIIVCWEWELEPDAKSSAEAAGD